MSGDCLAIALAFVGMYFGYIIGTYLERRRWGIALEKRFQWIYDKRISSHDFAYVVNDLLFDLYGMGWRKRLLNADLIYLPKNRGR